MIPELLAALAVGQNVVLQAPPGAGKTTRVPLAVHETPWIGSKRVVMLEPRRVAARSAASRLAELLGTHVGELVGYRMRDDTRVGPQTRIEVVTEGVLTNMLQSDPGLSDVGVIIFDEYHERSIHADIGLALSIEAQSELRPDLRLVVMSATLEGSRVVGLFDQAALMESHGRAHEVTTQYVPPAGDKPLENHLADVVSEIWSAHDTDVLAFLPGAGWIERAAAQLRQDLGGDALVTPLYSALPPAAQDLALRPDEHGRRKVILATDIAETSLTIEGVGVVVDSGRRRAPRLDARTGLTRLETVRISKASADQRRGRAGRLGPGACYRLWAEAEHRHLEDFDQPEILTVDLTGLRLQLACWGASADELRWLDRPPEYLLDESAKLLRSLGALDDAGRPTPHGRAIRKLGMEPRLAHMLLRATDRGLGPLACELAALLSGRTPSDVASVDIADRVKAIRAGSGASRWHRRAEGRAQSEARRLASRLGVEWVDQPLDDAGMLLAMAYPDRVALKRSESDSYLLSSGRGAELRPLDPLVGSELLVVPDIDGDPARSRIRLAARLDRSQLGEALEPLFERTRAVEWDPNTDSIASELRTTLGALVLKREPIGRAAPEELRAAWRRMIADAGVGILGFDAETERWRERVAFLARRHRAGWPDVSDEALLRSMDTWLLPHVGELRRLRDLRRMDHVAWLSGLLDWSQRAELDRLAPTHCRVPSGSSIRIDYSQPDGPVLAVRVQEMFGSRETPTIAGGEVPLTLHLLSPAQRPVQVTSDLGGFWANTYSSVRGELMGRYPKHAWPEDPTTAAATTRTKQGRGRRR